MAKMYPENPEEQTSDPGKKTMGVYDKPGRKRPSRGLIIAIVLAIVILIAFLIASGFAMVPDTVPANAPVAGIVNTVTPYILPA